MKLLRRSLSIFLVFCMIFSTIIPAYADGGYDLSKDALMVSQEYAQAHPNGVVEFSTVKFETNEGAQDFDVIVVRRGGTSGKVQVDFKVVEVSAKYGDDFEIVMPAWYGEKTLDKKDDTPTLLEASLEENKDGIITTSDYIEQKNQEAAKTVAEEVYGVENSTTSENAAAEEVNAPQEPAGATLPAEQELASAAENTTQYKSSLHQMHDMAVGTVTDSVYEDVTKNNAYEIQNPEGIKVGDALNTLLPGASARLTFEDGENYKVFKVRIKDDSIVESPEQFQIGLFAPVEGIGLNGAELGNNFNAVCNINDNDEEKGQTIEFEQSEYYIDVAGKKAEIKLIRSGDINTYKKIELSTISGTAKADVHYDPVMTDTIFLPGETEKKIVVPLLTDEIEEILDFEVTVTADGKAVNGVNRTTVYLEPKNESAEAGTRKMVSGGKMLMAYQSYANNNEIVYYGNTADRVDSYFAKGTCTGKQPALEYPAGSSVVMKSNDGYYRWHYIDYSDLDLRGISSISWNWANSGKNDKENRSQFYLFSGDEKFYQVTGQFGSQWDWAGEGSGIGTYQRRFGAKIRFKTESWWNTYQSLQVFSIVLNKQQFNIDVRQADNLNYYSYNGNTTPVETPFQPGSVSFDNPNPYRDQIVTLTPNISEEGQKRGAYLVGYRIFDSQQGRYGDIIASNQINFTPDFIEQYIYNNHGGGSYWHESLIIKPVFARKSAKEFTVLAYDDNKGELKIGGTKYNNSGYALENKKIGDVLSLEINPKTGYTATKVKAYLETSIKDFGIPANIELAERTKVEPIFQRDNNTILIRWKAPATGNNEEMAANRARGIILHDKPDKMPKEEYDLLFRGVEPPKEGETPEEKEAAAKIREAKIRENYPDYRKNFEVYKIQNSAIGDTITLYAKPDPGYTVKWWTNADEGTDTIIGENDVTKYLPHIGSSFSFKVTNNEQNVYYYFEKINDPGRKVFKGKVISSLQTIKKQSSYAVSTKDPNTFKGVPGITVAAAVADSNDLSIVQDGKTYRTSAVTDESGNFEIYVPYGVGDALYSIKLMNGEQIYIKSVLINNTMYLEIPFMDDLKVMDMQISGIVSDSAELPIVDRQATLSVMTKAESNRRVDKVKFRSYDATGTRWQMGDAIFDGYKWNWTTNVMESFKNNGRITVELYDEKGQGHGEIETGYKLVEPPAAGTVALPDIAPIGDSHNAGGMFNVNPSTELGTSRNKQPVPTSDGAKTYSIAVNAGEILKQIVTDNAGDFDNKTIQQKVAILAAYLNDDRYGTDVYSKKWKPEPAADMAKAGTKTGKGKGSVNLNFDIGFYIQLTRKDEGNLSNYYFDYFFLYTAFSIDARQDFNTCVCGVPIYMTVKAGGRIRGLLAAEGSDKPLVTAYGYFPLKDDFSGMEFYGIIHVNAYMSIGGGVGRRGVLSAGVSGQMDLDLVYEPWDNGAGTLTFALNVDIDILIIPLKFRVAHYTMQLFKTPGYIDNNWLPEVSNLNVRQLTSMAAKDGKTNGYVGKLERASQMSQWLSENDKKLRSLQASDVQAGLYEPVPPKILHENIYKHPQPEIIPINGDEKLLLYVNDDLTRDDYDVSAIYYAVLDESIWSEWDGNSTGDDIVKWSSAPKLLQNDGKLDSDPCMSDLGDKILITWSSSNKVFGNSKPVLKDMLNNMDIYACFFDKATKTMGEITQITDDKGKYSNSMPKVAFDTNSGKIMVTYTKTDYNTEGVNFDENNVQSIGDYLYNSYSTIAYRIYDGEKWQTTYYEDETSYLDYEKKYGSGSLNGQRFIDFDIKEVVASPKIAEMTAASYGSRGIICYTLDIDKDPNTKEDTEIFMRTYDFGTRKMSEPIRLTDDVTADSNPQTIQFGENISLYWNNDGYISYMDIDGIIKYAIDNKEDELLIGNYTNALNEKNNDAAESFTVTMGDDGNMYLVWSEQVQKIEQVNGNDVCKVQRQLFAAMYDNKFYESGTDEEGNNIYTGAWGNKWQLTRKSDETNNNEQAVAVDKDGKVTIVNRKYIYVSDDATPDENDLKESDTSTLVARHFAPMSTLTIKDSSIELYPKYPRPGDSVNLKIRAINDGFIPSKKVSFKLDMIHNDGENIEMEPICDDIIIDDHLSSGAEVSANVNFTLPGDAKIIEDPENGKYYDYIIRIEAWEEDMQDTATVMTYRIKTDENLTLQNPKGYFIDNDNVRIAVTLLNLGNMDAENVTVTIENFDDEKMTKAMLAKNEADAHMPEPTILWTKEYDKLAVTDVLEIDEVIDIKNEYYTEDGDIELNVNVKQAVSADNAEEPDILTTVHSKTIVLQKEPAPSCDISDIIFNDKAENSSITIMQGKTQSLNAEIMPAAAANTHVLRYRSLNPEIADIDPSSGMITAKNAGTTQIVVEAVKPDNIYLMSADNTIYNPDGNVLEFNPEGTLKTQLKQDSGSIVKTESMNLVVICKSEDTDKPSKDSDSSNTGAYTSALQGNAAQSSGGVTEATLAATVSNGIANAVISDSNVDAIISQANKTGSENKIVQLNVNSNSQTSEVMLSMSSNAISKIASDNIDALVVKTPLSDIAFDNKALEAISKAAGTNSDVVISTAKADISKLPDSTKQKIGDRPVFDFTVKTGDRLISDFNGGEATVSIPYTKMLEEDSDNIVIYYVADDGSLRSISNCKYENGKATFTVNHFSKYAVGYNKVVFADLLWDKWYSKAMNYISARGILQGFDGNINPNRSISRADFLIMIMRAYDIKPNSSVGSNFDDAGTNEYYTYYLAAAKELGIVNGAGDNKFNPQANISRQDMFVILYKALKALDKLPDFINEKVLSDFNDSNEISAYAQEAMSYFVKAGIVQGSNGRLTPKANSMRSEAAQMIYNLIK